jgi:hypothetical protein
VTRSPWLRSCSSSIGRCTPRPGTRPGTQQQWRPALLLVALQAKADQQGREKDWRSQLDPERQISRPVDRLPGTPAARQLSCQADRPVGLELYAPGGSLDRSSADEDGAEARPRVVGAPEEPNWVAAQWAALPARYKMLVATSLAFVVCNMVRCACSGVYLLRVLSTCSSSTQRGVPGR